MKYKDYILLSIGFVLFLIGAYQFGYNIGRSAGYNMNIADLDGFDRTEIFFQEADRMGLFDCKQYTITKDQIIIYNRLDDGTITGSIFTRPLRIDTIEAGESKEIRIQVPRQ